MDLVASRKRAQLASIDAEYRPMELLEKTKLSEAPSVDNPAAAHLWATYFSRKNEIRTRSADEHVDQQFRQVRLARELTQISPIACFQYAMEALAGTGITRYMDFVRQVRRYRQSFIDFIKTEDRNDPNSLHIYPVREGLSQKPVDPNAVPRFEERPSYQSVIFPVGLLLLFNLVFFTAAPVVLSEMRSEINSFLTIFAKSAIIFAIDVVVHKLREVFSLVPKPLFSQNRLIFSLIV